MFDFLLMYVDSSLEVHVDVCELYCVQRGLRRGGNERYMCAQRGLGGAWEGRG